MRFFAALLFSFVALTAHAQVPPAPALAAKAWLLVDMGTGQALVEHNADERIEPASLTKLMTAYVVSAALKAHTLSGDQIVPVSEKAWKMGGSRMFIEPRHQVTVDQLMHGMVVQSGNDASVALAEVVAGSEEAFAALMNREAQRLGMTHTHFVNATGLPDPEHYTTARDLSLLAAAIVRDFPDHYDLYSIKEYSYNNITQPNRNRLLWLDPTVDGIKTGHTETAGYCLIASAKRGARRLISVVLGTDSDAMRTQESLKLLNFGFRFYDTVQLYTAGQSVSSFRVWQGTADQVKVGFDKDFVLSIPKGQADKLQVTLNSEQPLEAPVRKGQAVGKLTLTLEGKTIGTYPVQALEEVPLAGWFGRTWDSLQLWIKSL
ncbi:D-alanyl-D-alanine carboxypeptidase [Nitrogeniibacter mangrovi]|uniref:serine-type D-Ala-D-Ala carboxypeptidase n=1 Tax=Nitrogeniibacter mangrovi TaxID=2016596 RepID=A0A6C1B1Z9_9RHOO|nr:D-alanyl-D-alanine carboxypeptidase family protein [Nitrogeniibacter mangrovi]QID16370.1 D-alanyl-D-alanine carboxypeptidase [Nitrogeniibacter mangrovi]